MREVAAAVIPLEVAVTMRQQQQREHLAGDYEYSRAVRKLSTECAVVVVKQ